jgi:hypothetical protein
MYVTGTGYISENAEILARLSTLMTEKPLIERRK